MSEEENRRRTSDIDRNRKRKRSGSDTGTLRDDDPNFFVSTYDTAGEDMPETMKHLGCKTFAGYFNL
eukprot:scaffold8932_cov108-Cylindrotheca_fusiformis.AAC.3